MMTEGKNHKIHVLTGRAANKWRSGYRTGFKEAPWELSKVATLAELEAFKNGVRAAIACQLSSVQFLDDAEAAEVSRQASEYAARQRTKILAHQALEHEGG